MYVDLFPLVKFRFKQGALCKILAVKCHVAFTKYARNIASIPDA